MKIDILDIHGNANHQVEVPDNERTSGSLQPAGSAAICEWENVSPGPCANIAEYHDTTGKRLCSYHARHLERRFGAKMRPINESPLRLGAAGAQMQGRGRDTASQQTLSPNSD